MSEETVTLIITWAIRVLVILIIFYVAVRVSGWAGDRVRTALSKRFDKALSAFLANLVRWGLIALVALGLLGHFGIETTSFVALIAGVGFAVGLALQGTLANFSAGVMLVMFRPFTLGDMVTVAGITGKVHEIGIFATVLDTPDNRRLILPNGAIFGTTIENVTYHANRRVEVLVGVEYPAKIDHTKEVITGALQGVEGVLEEPAPQIYLDALGDSSVDYKVRVWCATADFWAVRERVTRAVKMALDEAGIGIPFPQMDVHLVKEGGESA